MVGYPGKVCRGNICQQRCVKDITPALATLALGMASAGSTQADINAQLYVYPSKDLPSKYVR